MNVTIFRTSRASPGVWHQHGSFEAESRTVACRRLTDMFPGTPPGEVVLLHTDTGVIWSVVARAPSAITFVPTGEVAT